MQTSSRRSGAAAQPQRFPSGRGSASPSHLHQQPCSSNAPLQGWRAAGGRLCSGVSTVTCCRASRSSLCFHCYITLTTTGWSPRSSPPNTRYMWRYSNDVICPWSCSCTRGEHANLHRAAIASPGAAQVGRHIPTGASVRPSVRPSDRAFARVHAQLCEGNTPKLTRKTNRAAQQLSRAVMSSPAMRSACD